jgi:prepilin-type N-terminal cleavage/methylation domain-containing protein
MTARRFRSDGMSLPELLVAVALSSIVLIGGTLLLVSLMRQAEKEVGRPPAFGGSVDLTMSRMERDLRQATALLSSVDGVETGPRDVILLLPGNRVIAYVKDGEELLRVVVEGDEEPHSRVLLTRLVTLDLSRRGLRSFGLTIRCSDQGLRVRRILARNLGRGGVPAGRS